jgi:hypothetical protein
MLELSISFFGCWLKEDFRVCSVTIKFLNWCFFLIVEKKYCKYKKGLGNAHAAFNWCCYSNTTDVIYWGWTGLARENISLYDVNVSACLVDAYGDYSCFGEISFFVMLKVSATETFEMLKSAYVEECLLRKVCLNGIKRSKKAESH